MRIAISGADGNIGRRVIEIVTTTTEAEVTAVTRRPVHYVSGQVRTAIADYDDRAALVQALDGASTVVLITSDGIASYVMQHHRNIVGAAAEANVKHVVSLSSLDADADSPFCYARTNAALEKMLSEEGFGTSIVRVSIFAELFAQWPLAARQSGEIRLPMADGRISLVGRDDVAAALAVLAVRPEDATYKITGPKSLGGTEIARLAGHSLSVPLKYSDVSPRQYIIEMAQMGVDAWWIYAYASMFDSIREQRFAGVTNDFLQLTGRAPTEVSDLIAGCNLS